MPKITVIIPNYNHACYLEQRIESVLSQTFSDREVLLLDDASTDESLQVIERYRGVPGVRIICNHANSGSTFKQWNKGLKLALGEYVWIAESDDYADSRFLQVLASFLDRHPSAGLVYCQSLCVDEKSRVLSLNEEKLEDLAPGRWKRDHVNNGRDEIAAYLIRQCTIRTASAALLRKSVCAGVGYADESFACSGDRDLYARMLMASDIGFVAQPLNCWRQHPGTVRSRTMANRVIVAESYRVMRSILDAVPVEADILEKALDNQAVWWAKLNAASWAPLKSQWAAYRSAKRVDSRAGLRLLRQSLILYYWNARVLLGRLRRKLKRSST